MDRPFVEGARLTFSEVWSIRHPFGKIAGVAVGGDGAVYVGDRQALVVWQFDSTGVLVDSIGAEGDGPGDFKNIGSLQFVGDRLLVFDGSLRRLTSFDAKDPEEVRTTTFRTPRSPGFAWVGGDGRVVAGATSAVAVGRDAPTDSMTVHLVSEGGVVESWGDTLLSMPRNESLVVTSPGFVMSQPMPFGGRSWVQAGSGGTVFFLWSGAPEIRAFDLRNSTWDTWPLPPGLGRSIEDSDYAALYASIDLLYGGGRTARITEWLIGEARADGRAPTSWPVASGLLADDSNRLWVTLVSEDDVILPRWDAPYEYGPQDGGGSHLVVFDLANGTIHAGRAPARGRIEAASGEHVYMRTTGPSDEEYIRQFRVRY